MISLFVWGLAWAEDSAQGKDEQAKATQAAPAEEQPAGMSDVTGLPLYQGPEYSSVHSSKDDVHNLPPQFHAFAQRKVEDVGFSPLTLEDFRFPVAKRTAKAFTFERMYYPEHSVQVWHDRCHGYSVTAFFFTRDMVRDHIQRLVDEYYICEPDLLQQIIDYYAEVTPQCGEVISWVWFAVDDNKQHHYADRAENRYFTSYLSSFKDKFYLEFGLPKVQAKVDEKVRGFLYQYQRRGKHVCGPEFKERPCGCDKCAEKGYKCDECDKCDTCEKPDCYECGKCPEKCCKPGDKALYCTDYKYHGFNIDMNSHYLYYPRKVVIEDVTYDPLAQAYRWKFAFRFNDCEVDWLRQMCQYGQCAQFALVLSDPTWYGYAVLDGSLKRDILASMDPDTWGNVWPAGNVPYDMSCCPCPLPDCAGNCLPMEPVGWAQPEPLPEPTPAAEPQPEPKPETPYFPPPPEKPKEVITVPGKG
jgi:hypothetical protein